MPRDIPVGNGSLLVTFDHRYQVRDVYFPHVGQENHAGAGPLRFGFYVQTANQTGRGDGRLSWTSDDAWEIKLGYQPETLTTDVQMKHKGLGLTVRCNDVVDFHRPVHVRRIRIRNERDVDRQVHVFHHQDFNMFGTKIGDTAYFDPDMRSMVHYRATRYIGLTYFLLGEQRIDEYATGTSGFGGAEGTFRDAEDGHLQMNAIAQGAVDSTAMIQLTVPAGEERVVYMAMWCGRSREELLFLHKWLVRQTPQAVIDRTTAYWRLWTSGTNMNFADLPDEVVRLFQRSLLTVRTQIDNHGAILAANDSDIMQFARDTYSYMWPRDGALVADSLDLAGFPDLARSFYTFCQRVITDDGYLLHKYNPDGSPASSWHPWVVDNEPTLPIQEDETALVVWAIWRHYFRYRDIEYIRPLWVDVVMKAADFMVNFRDEVTGLPRPSYDLWEERYGIHAFTVATVYGGLIAAWHFAEALGDPRRAERYLKAANEVKAGFERYFWSDKHKRFVRRLVPLGTKVPEDSDPKPLSRDGQQDEPENEPDVADLFEVDEILDASMFAIYKFGLLDVDDPRVEATMEAIKTQLWCKSDVGGVARYTDDYYHRVSDDIKNVPGNPWFICTLWLADYAIAKANTKADLAKAQEYLMWAVKHANPSGTMAEQINPYTGAPISVSPLTWSHATVVSCVIEYLEKMEQIEAREITGPRPFRMRVPGRLQTVTKPPENGDNTAYPVAPEDAVTASADSTNGD